MTIERAIRAMAGAVILISLALGYWVHEGFFLLTAFAGANLLQSGFTGFCPPTAVFRKLGLKETACEHPDHAQAKS
jgi:hypothetical protein